MREFEQGLYRRCHIDIEQMRRLAKAGEKRMAPASSRAPFESVPKALGAIGRNESSGSKSHRRSN